MHWFTFWCMLNQSQSLAANMVEIESFGLCCTQLEQLFATMFLLLLINGIRYAESFGAWSFRIWEDMKLGNRQGIDEVVRLIEKFWCLTTTAHHNINTDESIRHLLFYKMYLIGKQLGIIMTVHKLQHLVAATLKRNMEMRHELLTPGNKTYEFVADKVGFQAADTIALYALHIIQSTDKVYEFLTGRFTEITNVDTCDYNLLSSFSSYGLSLSNEVGNAAITTSSTGKRYGAISAVVVAPILHLKEIAGTIATAAAGVEQFRITHHDLRHSRHLSYLICLQLGVATHHNNIGAGVLTDHTVYCLPTFMVGNIGDGAGVDDTDISLLTFSGFNGTMLPHQGQER